MKRQLRDRYDREDRVANLLGGGVFVAVLVLIVWSTARDGSSGLLAWVGAFAVVIVGAALWVWVLRWIDTGRWFR